MAVVSNSSPLIALAAIHRLDLLPAIFELVLIPQAVAREISPSIPVFPTWLRTQVPSVLPPASLPRRRLGDGEWEALALAIELKPVSDPVTRSTWPAPRNMALKRCIRTHAIPRFSPVSGTVATRPPGLGGGG